MQETNHGPPQKDFGPDTSFLKRRIWGGICIAVVLAFLWFMIAVLGETFTCEGCSSFHSEDYEAPATWILVLGALVVVAISLIVPALAERSARSRADDEGN